MYSPSLSVMSFSATGVAFTARASMGQGYIALTRAGRTRRSRGGFQRAACWISIGFSSLENPIGGFRQVSADGGGRFGVTFRSTKSLVQRHHVPAVVLLLVAHHGVGGF